VGSSPTQRTIHAGLAKQVDAVPSRCAAERRAGSSPAAGTSQARVAKRLAAPSLSLGGSNSVRVRILPRAPTMSEISVTKGLRV
jgi:hypothetical protein